MSKNSEIIAIAIPTYKREKELIRLLKSIAGQKELPKAYTFEILVIKMPSLATTRDDF